MGWFRRTSKKSDSMADEALRRLEVEDLPAFVIIDSEGNNLYETGRKEYLESIR